MTDEKQKTLYLKRSDLIPSHCAFPKCKINDGDMLQIHHIDGNHDNDRFDNVICLCANHHAKVTRHPELLSVKTDEPDRGFYALKPSPRSRTRDRPQI
jgi:hypothetical protein